MSSLEKVDEIFYLIKKYILPTIFLIAGIYLLQLAIIPQEVVLNNEEVLSVEQDSDFLYAAMIMILVSVIWFLYLLNLIKSTVGYIIMAIMLVGSTVILYADYATVQREVEFNNKYADRDIEIKTRIMDVKAAEIAFREVNGTYTNSFEDLKDFVNNGTKMDFIRKGALPDRKITAEERDLIYGDNRPIDKNMTEDEAAFLAKQAGAPKEFDGFIRDTIYVSVMEAIFSSERYLDNRSKLGGMLAFHVDSMERVPFSSQLTVLDTASILKGDIRVPTLRISMTHPMQDPIDGFIVYTIGAVDDNHLRDNWSR